MPAIPRTCVPILLLAGLFAMPAPARELTVSAAASLGEAFTEMATRFEAQHPDTEVLMNFGSSGALLQQIAAGAPVDVLASADIETMDRAASENLINASMRRDFAGNTLLLVVPLDAPKTPGGLRDLQHPGLRRIAIGQPDAVPAGRYARAALEAAGLWDALSPRLVPAQNVRQALDYVARGEVDAAFVYATDLMARPEGVRRAFEVPLVEPIRYPIAPVTASRQTDAAEAFVRFVMSEEGQRVLRHHGFLAP